VTWHGRARGLTWHGHGRVRSGRRGVLEVDGGILEVAGGVLEVGGLGY
jgi:hypothetical protein